MLGEILVSALLAVSALFFVVDPIGLVPVFVTMTDGYSREKRKSTARKAALIFIGVVSFFAVGGGLIFRVLGVSLAAFKIAGGLLLMLTALDMLRGIEPVKRTTDEELDEASHKQDIAVVPLAMPLLAGPGAIATVMVFTSRATSMWDIAVVLVAIVITGLASYLILSASGVVSRALGVGGRSILERVMGLVLAAIAVQFVVDGISQALPGVATPPSATSRVIEESDPTAGAHGALLPWLVGGTDRRGVVARPNDGGAVAHPVDGGALARPDDDGALAHPPAGAGT